MTSTMPLIRHDKRTIFSREAYQKGLSAAITEIQNAVYQSKLRICGSKCPLFLV